MVSSYPLIILLEFIEANNFIDPGSDENSRAGIQAKLNKTAKFSKRPGTGVAHIDVSTMNYLILKDRLNMNVKGFGIVSHDSNVPSSGISRFNGHNYTVSINFNRPQQSKGQRPNKRMAKGPSQKSTGMKPGKLKRV